MIFIKTNGTTKVELVHFFPFHEQHGLGKTHEELEQEGLLVDTISEPEQKEGKIAVLHCNPSTKELWYEYEDIPKTPEQEQADKIKSLEEVVADLTELILLGGAN